MNGHQTTDMTNTADQENTYPGLEFIQARLRNLKDGRFPPGFSRSRELELLIKAAWRKYKVNERRVKRVRRRQKNLQLSMQILEDETNEIFDITLEMVEMFRAEIL